ncbi:MAG: maleylpyruvate isomerase N-terminal domain-containing protein [Pseudonocardiaceae bacterium]
MTARIVFASAAHAFAELVGRIPADQWEGPGLGVWTMRSLVGHTSSALSNVIVGLDEPADAEAITSAQGYYALARTVDPAIFEKFTVAATADGVAHGVRLGAEPVAAVGRLVEQAVDRVEEAADADLLSTAAGGMRLDSYLRTRTFELAVHSLDIADAADLQHGVPEEVLGAAAALAAQVAAQIGEGALVLRALTGRTPLPAPYSIL